MGFFEIEMGMNCFWKTIMPARVLNVKEIMHDGEFRYSFVLKTAQFGKM